MGRNDICIRKNPGGDYTVQIAGQEIAVPAAEDLSGTDVPIPPIWIGFQPRGTGGEALMVERPASAREELERALDERPSVDALEFAVADRDIRMFETLQGLVDTAVDRGVDVRFRIDL